MKLLPVEADLFHVDGRTGRHNEANSSFSRFCERASNVTNLACFYWPYVTFILTATAFLYLYGCRRYVKESITIVW